AVLGKKNINSVLKQLIPEPKIQGQNFLLFEGHWIPQGNLAIDIPEGYILTPTVRKNLRDIARIISLGKLPVLLQGDTSVGKTSLITYIAKASGNYCVRINNHEHTDLQEYIGSYATDSKGNLVFKEGVLVEAMRKGYWIILDELNLAPSDVLEALNRVLDDNRELFIPETQQVVKADPNFMLFATQNPPGLYGGRKMLSRAFRNRFVELHFDEIPRPELETILHQRCHIPPTYCKKMIEVMAELQVRRRGSAAVQGKDGFITLRDLFRWGQRYKHASKDMLTVEKFYDWDQHIADEGYLILAGKVRQSDERKIIEDVIEKHIKRKVDPENLFSLHSKTSPVTKSILEMILNNQLSEFLHIVWTYNMRRLAILIAKAFTFNEPVLLVGETGCGKTTICQILAALSNRQLMSVNCHMHTESSDFLGGLRPVRQYKNDGKLFEWVDGPLIKSMENGHLFLADEISLADDSVLERLNSLLESERQLVLSERGMEDNSDIVVITAVQNFHFIGTMNPGGDFGKKELSPALRNRFTEIWCDHVSTREDLLKVLEKSVSKGIALGNQEDGSSGIGNCILDFTDWLKSSEVTNKFPFSIRDLLSWVQFINVTISKGLLDVPEAYVHGACMTFLDCFGTTLTGHIENETLVFLHQNAIKLLLTQIKTFGNEYTECLEKMLCNQRLMLKAEYNVSKFGIKPFFIECGPHGNLDEKQTFTFSAPTTGSNTLRLLRGLQLNKAILLEGNPGVGKTSLVTALAKSSGHRVVRINLSDQTDITDLFGTDLPTEDGSFTFKEGAFLNALQNGDWILLDELNLAPQSVLEGLNACLDHRGEVFIPELGKTFKVKHETKLFACQNPLKQGGARRGLPASFLNRFTQVYIDTLTKEDLLYIVKAQYSQLPLEILLKIVEFNCKVAHEVTEIQSWGHKGGPWEMNLRDIQRWCEALIDDLKCGKKTCPGKYVDMLYINRMRTDEDKERMTQIYDDIFLPEHPRSDSNPQIAIEDEILLIGDVTIRRNKELMYKSRRSVETNLLILRNQLPTLKALAQNVKMNWLSIIVGPTATGKSSIIHVLADLTGNDLHVVPVTSAMDVSDLLGGFEQVDYNRNLESLYDEIETITIHIVRNLWIVQESKQWRSNKLLSNLYQYKSLQSNFLDKNSTNEDIKKFEERLLFLLEHCKKLLDCAISCNLTNENVEKAINNIIKLQNKVSALTSVNAGGKFEWVDSLLVKTLIEGSWLLLDNVNLTSAAVLDRLNGLLEPNGVLSISERGGISEIKPHPNFRVFFTMDPKYGEISRAMRNRGVEVFLLRPDDFDLGLSETMNYMDLVALLSSCGLPNEYHDICIRCHESLTAFVQGLERPTVSHLLQSAHLTWQQLIRGISSTTALLSSFSDVYIKPRNGSDFASSVNMSLAEMKNKMLKALEFELGTEDYDPVVSNDVNHTLSVKGLCTNSSYEVVKQIAHVVIKQTKDSGITSESLAHVLFCILTSYSKCSPELFETLHYILKKGVKLNNTNKVKALTHQLNDQAFVYLQSNKNTTSYKRFFPEAHQVDPEIVSDINTDFALLYFELQNIVLQSFLGENSFSALDYSNAVCEGKLTDDFTEYPILKNCRIYLEIIDRYIKRAIKSIKSSQMYFNDELLCLVVQLLNWRQRFIKVCSMQIFEKTKNKRTPILKDEIIPLLNVHRKWVQKYLLGELFKVPSNHDNLKSFSNELKSLMLNTEQDNSKIAKVAKKLRKCYGQPKLYKNQNEHELSTKKTELYSRTHLDMLDSVDRQLYKVSIEPSYISDATLALDVPDKEIVKDIENTLARLVQNMSDNAKFRSQLKLLPMNLYVIQRIINILQPYLVEVVNKISDNEINLGSHSMGTNCVEFLISVIQTANVMKGFPTLLLDQLKIIRQILEGSPDMVSQRISSLPVSFWNDLYTMLASSPVTYPTPFLNQKSMQNSEEIVETIPANTKRMSTNLPLMSYYLQNLTTSLDLSSSCPVLAYEKLSLKDRVDYSMQLGTILNILWKNIGTLDAMAELKLKSDANFEQQKYTQLLYYLNYIVSEQCNVGKNTENSDDGTVQTLQVHFKDDTHLLKLFAHASDVHDTLSTLMSQNLNDTPWVTKVKILTSQLSLLTSFILVRIMAEISPIDHVEKYRFKVQYIEEDISMFNKLLSAYYVHGVISGTISENRNIEKPSQVATDYYKAGTENRDRLKKVHPYCKVLMELKETTAQSVHKYASGNTFRPKEPSYGNFVKDCTHFTKSMLSDRTTTAISSNLISSANSLYEIMNKNAPDKAVLNKAQTAIKETSSWMYSVKAFNNKVKTVYSVAFPDLAKPLQSSLSQIVYSVTTMTDLIKQLLAKIEHGPDMPNALTSLLEFPNAIPNKAAREKHLNRFVSSNLVQLLKRNAIAPTEDASIESQCLEVLKMNLSEISMSCIASQRIDQITMNAVLTTFNALVKAWEKQRQDIEKKKQDDEALYVTKSKCEDEDEDAIAEEEIMEMFPSYSESDFGEFKPPTLEQRKIKAPTNKPKYLISSEDVSLIYKWHSNFVRNMTSAEWLPSPKKLVGNDVLSPLLLRYPTFSSVIQEAWEALDANFEGRISPSFLVIVSHIKAKVDGSDATNQKPDFYRSAWVSETKECVPLLNKVKESTNELLDQWPDFPTLKDIIIIVDRILSFPITSPVSRFLTGLELLRDKIEEWNKNAHKGNNLIDISLAVGQQIINWRKLEMSNWKECLNNLYQR
ncbi:jg10052, partial [Pararge aegeria aegeria]